MLNPPITCQDHVAMRQPQTIAVEERFVDQQVFQQALAMTRMPIALADMNLPDCPLAYVNPAFSILTGYTPAEVVGLNCRFLQGPETDPNVVDRIRQALAAHEVFDEEIYNYRKDGSGFWNSLHLSPVFDLDGNLTYYFASQIDVSFKREAARRQAQRMASIRALSTGVAHKFNNLMTVVAGNVERASRRAADHQQQQYLDRADWAAQRAGQLAGELISLTNRKIAQEKTADLNAVLQNLAGILDKAAGRGIQVRLDLAPMPIFARLDPGQLEAVLLALVSNAADATADDGEIIVATSMLSAPQAAAAVHGQDAVELSVTDSGTGMPAEVAKRATELFFTTKGDKRTGVGLFVVLAFVDQSGGKLTISSDPGQGTIISMIFPKAELNV